jgi:hypothetical protein
LTYRYGFIEREEFYFGAGLTGKVRDAEISLDNGIERAEKKNVGFVPLINFSCRWKFYGPFGILIDGDALFATQGRAEDISLALLYHLNRNLTFRGGYRILEGGADNDEVYTFSMFHYALVGIRFQFWSYWDQTVPVNALIPPAAYCQRRRGSVNSKKGILFSGPSSTRKAMIFE